MLLESSRCVETHLCETFRQHVETCSCRQFETFKALKKNFEDAVNCTRSLDCHSLFSAGNFSLRML